jgi:hypothetical protein
VLPSRSCGANRRIRPAYRVVAAFTAFAAALLISAVASPAARAATQLRSPSLALVLGQPSTSQIVPPGYGPRDEVQCWTNVVLMSSVYPYYYVSTELTFGWNDGVNDHGMLRARATAIGPWERYTICFDYTDHSYSIRSPAANAWVSAELLYPGIRAGMLRARANAVGPWEKFDIVDNGGQGRTIRSLANDRFVAAEFVYVDPPSGDPRKGMMRARTGADAIGPWELFYLLGV